MARGKVLTAIESERIRALLEKLEKAHYFSKDEGVDLINMLKVFDEYGEEIAAVVEREKARRLWAKLRKQGWAVIVFALTTVTMVGGTWKVIQEYGSGFLKWAGFR